MTFRTLAHAVLALPGSGLTSYWRRTCLGGDQDSLASFGRAEVRDHHPKGQRAEGNHAQRHDGQQKGQSQPASTELGYAKCSPGEDRPCRESYAPAANSLRRRVQGGKCRRRANASSHVAATIARRTSSACRKDIPPFIGNECRPSEFSDRSAVTKRTGVRDLVGVILRERCAVVSTLEQA